MKRVLISLLCLCCTLGMIGNAYGEGEPTTRLDAVNVIYQGSSLKDESADLELLYRFRDFDVVWSLHPWHQEMLALMVKKGIMIGDESSMLHPMEALTRAEYAVMLYRARNYFDELPRLVDYLTPYEDVADWNAEAIRFCMERGLMMGYGTKFGVDDTLTKEQVTLIQRRMQNGLNTAEKYTLLSLNGVSPIDMTKISQSAYDEKLAVNFSSNYREWSLEEKQAAVNELQNYIEMTYNFDYRKYDSEEDLRALAKQIANLSVKDASKRDDEDYDDGTEEQLTLLKENAENQYIAECFFVTSPYSFGWYPSNGGANTITAKGYLYFKIESGLEWAVGNNALIYDRLKTREGSNLLEQSPAELQQGKWYRQIIQVQKYKSPLTTTFEVRNHSKIEPVPKEFLN